MGQVWRIGVMGYNATDANVALVVAAFKDGLEQQGFVEAIAGQCRGVDLRVMVISLSH